MSFPPYTFKFFRHVEKFCHSYDLLPPSGKLFIASSTGIDSMVLLEFGKYLLGQGLIKSLEILHINHGLRPESLDEENFLRDYCLNHGLTLHVKRLNSLPKSNFEAWARDQRYHYFSQFLKNGDRVATAHHLDDAFEWSLLQQFKSSASDSKGIPLQRGKIIRPFLCVSKKQIELMAKKNHFIFFHDQTNFDPKYERNFIRLEIIPKIQSRFPKYLKHFVQRSLGQLSTLIVSKNSHKVFHHPFLGIHVRFETIPTSEEIIVWIKKVSNSKRGSLQKEIQKLISSIENDGKGPMAFSGGVRIYFNRSEMVILNSVHLVHYRNLDLKATQLLQMNQVKTIDITIKDLLALEQPFPRLIISHDPRLKNILKSSKEIHPLFPTTSSHLIENTVWFCSANQLLKICRKDSKYFEQVISIINLHQALETA